MEDIHISLTQLNYDEVTKEIMSIETLLTNNTRSIPEDNGSKNQFQLITLQAMNNNILKITEERFNSNNTIINDFKNMLVKILENLSINYKKDFEIIQQKIFNASPHQLIEKKLQDLMNKLLQIDSAQEAELTYLKELVNCKNMEARNKSQNISKNDLLTQSMEKIKETNEISKKQLVEVLKSEKEFKRIQEEGNKLLNKLIEQKDNIFMPQNQNFSTFLNDKTALIMDTSSKLAKGIVSTQLEIKNTQKELLNQIH
jgi:hypothetical protein